MRLDGKIAIVTGAGGGMGRASALLFAENGARLLLTDKNEESGTATQRMLADKGHEAIFVPGNVGRRADVQHFVQIAAEAYGRIDILFNNSGSDEGSGDLLAVDDEAIEACIASNLKSVILCCQAVVPIMIAGDGGSIVTTASITGMRGQNGLGVYGAAKAGVINFMRYIAWEYGPLGIRANSICPGAINTPLLRAGMQDPAAQPVVQYFLHQAPLQRIGEPADIAETALFLASSASAHITGQAIPVDGGMTCGTFLDPTRITSFARDVLDRTTALEA